MVGSIYGKLLTELGLQTEDARWHILPIKGILTWQHFTVNFLRTTLMLIVFSTYSWDEFSFNVKLMRDLHEVYISAGRNIIGS